MKLRKSRIRRAQFLARMDMTPMVDVMFSLLVMFMITAPMITTGIPLDLPSADNAPINDSDAALDISVDRTGRIYIGEEVIKPDDLTAKIKSIRGSNPNLRLIISADRGVDYGAVVELMGLLRQAGYAKIGLKTDARKDRREK